MIYGYSWYFGDLPEDHYEVDSEKVDMREVDMIMENIIINTSGTILKCQHSGRQIQIIEHHLQVINGTGNMDGLNMVMEYIKKKTCGIFLKVQAFREEKFIHFKNDVTSILYKVLQDHVEVLHVLPLAVHLVLFHTYVNLFSCVLAF